MLHRRIIAISAFLLVGMAIGIVNANETDYRVWVDSSGKHKITAQFVVKRGDSVRLLATNGKSLVIPLDKLSAGDQIYIRQRLGEEAGKRASIPFPSVARQTPRNDRELIELRRDNADLRLQISELENEIAGLEVQLQAILVAQQPVNPPQRAPAVVQVPVPVYVPSAPVAYIGVGDGHWISDVSSDGSIITLEDRSVWKVDAMSRLDTALWLPPSDIAVVENSKGMTPYLLINKDDGETAEAELLTQ